MRVDAPTKPEVMDALARLRRQGSDDALCEAKSCVRELGRSVWESVSAFANTSGGLLLLGIDEHAGFSPAEGFDANKAISQLVEGMGDGSLAGARLTHSPSYELGRVEIDGRTIVAVRIAENAPSLKPCYVTARGPNGGAFRRIDDRDVQLSPGDVFELSNVLIPSTAEREVVSGASVEDLDRDLLERFFDARKGTKSMEGVQGDADRLRRAGVTDSDGNVLLAGLVAFGRYPQQFLPLCHVDVTVWPGMAGQQESDVRYVDRVICEGPLSEMVSQAVAGVLRNLRTAGVVQDIRRIDVPEVPAGAIREAIANALLHREYGGVFRNVPVTVRVFRDRIEVTSSGGLWGGKTVDSLADGTSRCRNALLMQIMRDAPYKMDVGASIEGLGRGIAYMRSLMLEAGLPAPSFRAEPDRFTVRLARPADLVEQPGPDGRSTVARVPYAAPLAASSDSEGRLAAAYRAAGNGHGSSYEKPLPALDGFAPAGFGEAFDTHDSEFHPAGYNPWAELAAQPAASQAASAAQPTVPDAQTPEHFFMMTKDGWVIEVLAERYPNPLDIREIAESGGKSLPTARRAVRDLIDAGKIIPTAPPTSRNRKYVLAASA